MAFGLPRTWRLNVIQETIEDDHSSPMDRKNWTDGSKTDSRLLELNNWRQFWSNQADLSYCFFIEFGD